MKINKILFLTTFFLTITSNAQITKGNWMMGGSANFGNYKTTSGGSSDESTNLNLYPNIGYFVIDKLALGTSGQFNYTIPKSNENKSSISYGFSPFARYYFLEKEKSINIFSEVSYEILRNNLYNSKVDKFKIKAGTVFFLNSSVGIEVALNYSNQKTNTDYQNRAIYLDVGFQIHLERI